MSTKQSDAVRTRRQLHSVAAGSTAGTAVPPDVKLLAGVGKPATSKPAPARKPAARAVKSAPKPQPAKAAKTAATPKGTSASVQRNIALSELVRAAGALIEHWDPAATGIDAETARDFISHRLAYCGPGVKWDERLGEKVQIASRTGKST